MSAPILRRYLSPSSRERVVFWSIAGAMAIVTALGVWHLVDQHRATVVSEERAAFHVAVDRMVSRGGAALHRIALTEMAIKDAQATLDSSKGKTLDETARTALEDSIRRYTQLVGVARAEQKLTAAAAHAPKLSYWAPEYAAASAVADQHVFVSAAHLNPVPSALTLSKQAVTDAVAAWQKEQERIAAEKKAQEEAAARAAAEAAAREAASSFPSSPRASSGSSAGSSAGAATYHEYVWTSGWQPQIDACNGGVDLTDHYGVRTVAEHSYCGGYAWPKTPGTLVQFSGVDSGLYRVIGIVANLNGHTASTADLPRGYDMLYQTCVNGYSNMSFTALERIG